MGLRCCPASTCRARTGVEGNPEASGCQQEAQSSSGAPRPDGGGSSGHRALGICRVIKSRRHACRCSQRGGGHPSRRTLNQHQFSHIGLPVPDDPSPTARNPSQPISHPRRNLVDPRLIRNRSGDQECDVQKTTPANPRLRSTPGAEGSARRKHMTRAHPLLGSIHMPICAWRVRSESSVWSSLRRHVP